MQKYYYFPDKINNDLTIINAIKILNSTQKQRILDKIEDIKEMHGDTEINSSSTINAKDSMQME